MQKVYQVKEVQKITGLARNSVMALINSRRLKAIRAGRRILIPAWSLDEFLGQAN